MIQSDLSSIAEQLGLLPEEYEQIIKVLGRRPNYTELSMFSVMWSEHCSYKNSILQLKTLPKEGERVLKGAGEEGAGLMDLGNGYAVAFKMESHNHPSAIEPYQGAATGVGGIHRDIFSLGARPICALNSLRFGDLNLPRTQHLLKGVVKGIGDYGNAFGVATVGGEIYFDPCYNTNPLVNAMSVGIVEKGKSVSATASGVGNTVFIVGSATGKDGIHGATFASEDISEDSEEKLPSVQIGDPFTEKLLLEATLEVLETGVVVGVQDMGAAGITCATSEMAAKGEVGMHIQLDRVPTREKEMDSYEILLSESQERMLLVAHAGEEEVVRKIFSKWDLYCEAIGWVTDDGLLTYYMGKEVVAEIPAQSLVLGGGAPVYEREQKVPTYYANIQQFDPDQVPQPAQHDKVIRHLLSDPSISSKRWVFEQYDSMVGTGNASTNLPSDAAVVRLHGRKDGIVVTSDCNSRYVFANPEKGAVLAVAEAARNIVCSGGIPIGVTNCLNFGNPYNPEVYFQFAQAIKGMGIACKAFGTPITGGNVSFYNQSEEGPVYPTPTIGMVGIIEDISVQQTSLAFKQPGDLLYLVGKVTEDFNSSAYVYSYHKVPYSPAPYVNIQEEVLLQQGIRRLINMQLLQSAHDVSDGGLIISLLESAFVNCLGFHIHCPKDMRKDAFLYGESGGRVVISIATEAKDQVERTLEEMGLPSRALGIVGGSQLQIDEQAFDEISSYKALYDNSLQGHL
ncbi:MAG: phosphoribosylformylglycinamidine synthase subunit PurL [Bacteroidota bacterium]